MSGVVGYSFRGIEQWLNKLIFLKQIIVKMLINHNIGILELGKILTKINL